MSIRRVRFCGAITGSVPVMTGESEEQALERAETTLLAVLDRGARRLQVNIGLEVDDTPEVTP